MASNRSLRMVMQANNGEMPVPFSKTDTANRNSNIESATKKACIEPCTASLSFEAKKRTQKNIAPVDKISLQTQSPIVEVFEHKRNTMVDDWVDASVAFHKSYQTSPSFETSLPVNETTDDKLEKKQETVIQNSDIDHLGEDTQDKQCDADEILLDNIASVDRIEPQPHAQNSAELFQQDNFDDISISLKTSENKPLDISHPDETLPLYVPAVLISAEKAIVPTLKELCSKIVSNPTNPDPKPTNDLDSCEVNEDFSGTDDDDNFVPNQNRKRKRLLSNKPNTTTSSSSSGSTSSSSSGSTSSSAVSVKKGKKKKRNVQTWKRNKTKLLRNSGKEYVSRTGKKVAARQMKPPCTNKCRLFCATKLTNDERQKLFDNYWSLSSLQRQRDYLSSCSSILQVPVRRLKTTATKDRRPNSCFSFVIEGKSIRVCKTYLLNTLGISERALRTVSAAKISGTGVAPADNRGHHSKTSVDPEVAQSVRDHINSVPRVESHYLRAKTSREYVDGGLTIAEMHRKYKELRDSLNKDAAKYEYYANVFNTEFNISFFSPKKDQCDVCEEYKNAVGEEKVAKEEGYKEHQIQKELSRKEKAQDIKSCEEPNSSIIVAIYDLQAVMPVPVGDSSAFFYKSKLNCYNFTVTDVKNKGTTCFFWHEGLGNRGAIEIGSCVYKFLEKVAESNPNCDVIFYSDNCCGQQKNKFILAMYHYAVSTLNINSVTHKFLVRGHTQNEGDNAHSLIEKGIKRAKKSGPIYVPSQYAQIIRTSKKTGKVFDVRELNYDDFIDLKALSEEIGMNSTRDIDGKTVKVTEIRLVRFQKNSDTFEYKTTYYEDVNWTKVPIQLRLKSGRISRKDHVDIHEVTMKPAYNSKIVIEGRKKADLTELVKRRIVPQQYACFYESIF